MYNWRFTLNKTALAETVCYIVDADVLPTEQSRDVRPNHFPIKRLAQTTKTFDEALGSLCHSDPLHIPSSDSS
jgi:hypothetical protein